MTVEGRCSASPSTSSGTSSAGSTRSPRPRRTRTRRERPRRRRRRYRVVAYRGDTQQAVRRARSCTRARRTPSRAFDSRAAIDGDVRRAGLDPAQMAATTTRARSRRATPRARQGGGCEGESCKDVFELTEWLRSALALDRCAAWSSAYRRLIPSCDLCDRLAAPSPLTPRSPSRARPPIDAGRLLRCSTSRERSRLRERVASLLPSTAAVVSAPQRVAHGTGARMWLWPSPRCTAGSFS